MKKEKNKVKHTQSIPQTYLANGTQLYAHTLQWLINLKSKVHRMWTNFVYYFF